MSASETIFGLGARTDYLAKVPHLDLRKVALSAQELLVLAQVGRISRIDEILARSGVEEPLAIAALLSLRAKGVVAPAKLQKKEAAPLLDLSAVEEVELPPERRKEILDLERSQDGLNPFELLGLRPGASPEEAKQAWYDASRRYHPDRYFAKNLGSFRARIEQIYKRLTEAYETLSDPRKRAAFLADHPELAPAQAMPDLSAEPTAPADPVRAAERRARMARHPYLAKNSRVSELLSRARAHLDNGEPGLAYTDLQLALRIDPGNREAQQALPDVRRRYDAFRSTQALARAEALEGAGELRQAAEQFCAAAAADAQNGRAAYKAAALMAQLAQDPREVRALAQRAVEVDPKNADAQVLLGSILIEAGMKSLARKHVETALELNPEHATAKRMLNRLRWPFPRL